MSWWLVFFFSCRMHMVKLYITFCQHFLYESAGKPFILSVLLIACQRYAINTIMLNQYGDLH